jgi:hypothetical protein
MNLVLSEKFKDSSSSSYIKGIYCITTNSTRPVRPPRFKVGDLVDIQRKNGDWMVGKIVDQQEYQVTVHFLEGGITFAKTMQDYSKRIAPVGQYSKKI